MSSKMKNKEKEYIDLAIKSTEDVFIPGLDDPVEWEAKKKQKEVFKNHKGGCCIGNQTIKQEEKHEQNLAQTYKDVSSRVEENKSQDNTKKILNTSLTVESHTKNFEKFQTFGPGIASPKKIYLLSSQIS